MLSKQDRPLISIIIPTRNRCELLQDTLASLQAQTYPNWEAVVVDDLSTDDTWAVLDGLSKKDSRIRPVKRGGSTGGAVVARNLGIDRSCGSYILFLDSDDLLTPTAIERRLRGFEEYPEADAIVGDSEYFREIPGEYHDEWVILSRLSRDDDPLEAFLTGQSPWLTSGPLWRREAVLGSGRWKTADGISDDNPYHLQALANGIRFIPIGTVDWYVRLHGRDHLSSPARINIPGRLTLLEENSRLLRSHHLLTRRNMRMLAWSCLLSSLTCAVEHAAADVTEAKAQWSAARALRLVGAPTYFAGGILVRVQWSMSLGLVPREIARFVVYLDLKRKRPVTKRLVSASFGYMRYLIIHSGHWNRARVRRSSEHRVA